MPHGYQISLRYLKFLKIGGDRFQCIKMVLRTLMDCYYFIPDSGGTWFKEKEILHGIMQLHDQYVRLTSVQMLEVVIPFTRPLKYLIFVYLDTNEKGFSRVWEKLWNKDGGVARISHGIKFIYFFIYFDDVF